MSLLGLPKTPSIRNLADALELLAATVERNSERLDAIELAQGSRIASLEHDIAEHQAGAVQRQQEVDALKAEIGRTQWRARFGRRR
jgi:hypothetical protein